MSADFEITSDIPPPQDAGPKGRRRVYPWHLMKPGDSIVLPLTARNSGLTSLYTWRKEHPKQKFMSRKMDGGVRVWRLE